MIMWDRFTYPKVIQFKAKPASLVYTHFLLTVGMPNVCKCGQWMSQSQVIFSIDSGPLVSETLEKLRNTYKIVTPSNHKCLLAMDVVCTLDMYHHKTCAQTCLLAWPGGAHPFVVVIIIIPQTRCVPCSDDSLWFSFLKNALVKPRESLSVSKERLGWRQGLWLWLTATYFTSHKLTLCMCFCQSSRYIIFSTKLPS